MADYEVAHLSPARFEHINPFGRYHFDVALSSAGQLGRCESRDADGRREVRWIFQSSYGNPE